MARVTLSFVMFASRAFSRFRRRRGLLSGSPPPALAATVISLMSRVKTLPFFASAAALRCLMFAHLLCPAIAIILRYALASSHRPARKGRRQDVARAIAGARESAWPDHRRDRHRQKRHAAG